MAGSNRHCHDQQVSRSLRRRSVSASTDVGFYQARLTFTKRICAHQRAEKSTATVPLALPLRHEPDQRCARVAHEEGADTNGNYASRMKSFETILVAFGAALTLGATAFMLRIGWLIVDQLFK